MGYKVLKQGWRLIAILAIGFSSGCSGNEKIKGIDLDEVGYGSSVFSVLKGEDYESEALKLPIAAHHWVGSLETMTSVGA